MIIGIPVDTNSMSSDISDNFGRTNFFLIYDDKKDESTFLDNTAKNSQGGAGIEAAQILVDKNVDIIITPRCGKNAAEVLKFGDIDIYKSEDKSVEDNLNKLKENTLSPLSEIHPGLHRHGSN
jgi:predicted Fe-Mo cluster-binding NifX family protein